ncbi:1-acyl-sn-glycerol-3-phosphate acyltransferase [Opitutaceae bacterium TAV4]|nr:1-acyl-sn-glycerol-3-phosphate acyltransferase [Opitutaceae bacterium TAV4]RRJ99381.1 1-acyl-sn-glycerol-3-phosphate acyltransferase [Opitutaceae bacterium TAV3]
MDAGNTTFLNLIARRWRNAATALSFFLFGLGGLFLAFAVIPLAALFSRLRTSSARHDLAQRCISASFRIYIRIMRGLRAIDFRIENAALLREDENQPLLVVANHPSLLDYVFLASLMPRCDCIVKKPLAQRNFFTRPLVKAAGYIPNDDTAALFDACRERFAQGRRILIFPEGTRSTPGQPILLQRGAANLAVRCRVPLRVIHITCTPPILTRQHKWWQTAATRPVFRITVREKIDVIPFLEASSDGEFSPWRAARLLNARLQRALDPRATPANTTQATQP